MSTSLAAASSKLPLLINLISHHPVKTIGSALGFVSLFATLKYRHAIRKRYKQLREESWLFGSVVTMQRVVDTDGTKSNTHNTSTGVFQNLRLMELDPDFQAKCQAEGHKVIGLGDYLSQLRPKGLPKKISTKDTPKLIQREIEAALAAGLLKVLGPNLGRVLLPAVGAGAIQKQAQSLAGGIATNWFMSEDGSISASNDKGGIPIALMTLLSISEMNAKVNSGKTPSTKDEDVTNIQLNAMDKMKLGEVVKGPAFDQGSDDVSLIPNDFVVSEHFDNAIKKMEDMLAKHEEKGGMESTELKIAQDDAMRKGSNDYDDAKTYKAVQQGDMVYDPEDRRMGKPVPVNPRLFPDLHLGWGDALSSHTKREEIKMRLLAMLLNKLGANCYRRAEGEPESSMFRLRMKLTDKAMTTPWEFVQALQVSGHKVEVVPTSRMTTFGVALCVKEKDNCFSNIPMGVFLETGYEDQDGNMAPAMMPHSGLDMIITGELAETRADGTPSELNLQHFVSIEGFCGWHSNSNPIVPYNEAVEQGPRLTGDDAVRASRIAGLYAICLNGLATEMELPFGGYGLTAVCNDSAALVQECLYGTNTIYPMTSIGRFLLKTMRYAKGLQDRLSKQYTKNGEDVYSLEPELQDLRAIIHAMKKLPSDLNASPSLAHSAASRLLVTLQPSIPLKLMKDSKNVMESILREDTLEEVSEAGHDPKDKVLKTATK